MKLNLQIYKNLFKNASLHGTRWNVCRGIEITCHFVTFGAMAQFLTVLKQINLL